MSFISKGWLNVVPEMKNKLVTMSPLFVQQVNNPIQCGRLCRKNVSCLSVFLEDTGDTVICYGHSAIYNNGSVSIASVYYIVG